MEKKLLTATALSFLVLFLWYTVVAPPRPVERTKNFQPISNNEVIKEQFLTPPNPPPLEFVEEKHILKTKHFDLEFTNKGGNLNRVILQPYYEILPVNNFLSISSLDNKVFSLQSSSSQAVVYIYKDETISLKKEYKFNNSNGLLNIEISGSGISPQELMAYNLDMSILDEDIFQKGIISKGEKYSHKSDSHFQIEKSLFEYVVNSGKRIYRHAKAFQFISEKNNISIEGLNNWVAFRNRYYCAILKPNFDVAVTTAKTLDKEKLGVFWNVPRETIQNNIDLSATVYLGAEDRATLKSFGLGFEKIKRFYTWVIFEWPARFIYYLMHGIHKFIPIWGLCIILISLAVYLATYPLTFKSMASMRKMQQIQPEIAALRDKYKDNPKQMNTEMMAIYHRYNINPMSGCLPMLLQMPVFIGLYQVLWRDVSFKGEKFLWIKDLSQPDQLVTFSQNLPFIGNELNLLPILMIGIMFVQQRLSMKSMVVTDEAQLMQQRMMSYFMPVLLGVIFYKFSSGLTLYFVLFYTMSTLTQWKLAQNSGNKT